MKSRINGCKKFFVDEKNGIADEILLFYPETYLKNKDSEFYTSLNTNEIICEFIIKEKLGEGAFGSVRLGINKQTGEKVAIKILEKSRLTRNEDKIRLEREIEILKKLKHPNIVQLYSVIETEKQLFIIMEYIKGQELYQYILLKKRLQEDEACLFFQQIISGIEYLHKLKIAHRDIKSENIIIEQNTKTIKILDFGLSNIYGDKDDELLRTACGSPCYAAPEMLCGEMYKGRGVDIWSAGIVLFAMVCGYLPFEDDDNSELYKKIISGKFTISVNISNQARDLIYKILNTNPRKRINISQIKNHSWIKFYGNGLNNGKPIFNSGLFINKYVIPIDEDIIDDMEKIFHISKMKSRTAVLSNSSNDYTTLYYLILKQKINSGKKSVSDLKCDLFLNYIKDKRNLLSNYKNSLKYAINARKMGTEFEEEYLNNNNGILTKDSSNVKSQDNIFDITNINNSKTLNCKTPNYKSSLDFKINTNNKKKLDETNKNIKKSRSNNNYSISNDNNINKTKKKKKNYKINTENEREIINILDNIVPKTSKSKNNIGIKNAFNETNNNNNNEIDYDINNKKNINKFNLKIYNKTLSPIALKNKKYKKSNEKRNLKKKDMSEISLDNKNNKTSISLYKNSSNLIIEISKRGNKLQPRQRNENKKNVNSHDTIKEEKETKTIEAYKPEKEKEKEKEINTGISKEREYNKVNKSNNEFIIINKNEDKIIDIEDKTENNKINIKDDLIKIDSDLDKKFPINQKLNIQEQTLTILKVNDKYKYEPTLDSFSYPTINQEKNGMSYNNYIISQNILGETYSPQKDLNIKVSSNKRKIKIKNLNKKNNTQYKINKTKLIKTNSNTKFYDKKENKINNFYDNKYNTENLMDKSKKNDNINNIQINNNINSRDNKKKNGFYKKIGKIKRYLESNTTTNIFSHNDIKEKNKVRINKKIEKGKILIESIYHLTNNLSTFSDDQKLKKFDSENKKKIFQINNDIKLDNNIRNKKAKKYRNKKVHSIDYKLNINNNNSINERIKKKEETLIRINTINDYINNNYPYTSDKNNTNNNNKFSLKIKKNYKKINLKEEKELNINEYKSLYKNNSNEGNSGYLFKRNDNNYVLYPKKKILSSDINSPKNYDLYKKSKNNYIDYMELKNNNKKENNIISNNNIMIGLKKYFSYKEININENSYKDLEPFDLNCIFIMPRKILKEKLLNNLKNVKCRIKQIKPYKYNINSGDNKIKFEFYLPKNILGIVKFKKVKGNNKEYAYDIRRIMDKIK